MSSNPEVQRRANKRFQLKNPDYNRMWRGKNIVNPHNPHDSKGGINALFLLWGLSYQSKHTNTRNQKPHAGLRYRI